MCTRHSLNLLLLPERSECPPSWAANAWHWLGGTNTHLSPFATGVCACVCEIQRVCVSMVLCSSVWTELALSALVRSAGRQYGEVIMLLCCHTPLCSCIHFEGPRERRAERSKEEEAWEGDTESSMLILIQAHALVAPLGPFTVGGLFSPLLHDSLSPDWIF